MLDNGEDIVLICQVVWNQLWRLRTIYENGQASDLWNGFIGYPS